MDKDIKTFAAEIAENIGAEFSVFSDAGENLIGSPALKISDTNFFGVKRDEKEGVTYFKFKYKNKEYIGGIRGEETAAAAFSYLISELAEKAYSKESSVNREDFFKSVLFGETSFYKIKKYAKKFGGEDKPAFVIYITAAEDRIKDVKFAVENYSDNATDAVCEIEDGALAFIKFKDETFAEYRSVTEYTEYLLQFILEETGEKVGAFIGGTVKNISDLSASFTQAVAASRMAEAYGETVGVHTYKEFITVKIVEDLPKYKLTEYLETLLDHSAKEIFDDAEMVATAETFLENNLNVSETSRKMYLHRNTLNYRLDKIEKATGLNIRNISDAITFRLIIILLKTLR